jgi:hypothetical protein
LTEMMEEAMIGRFGHTAIAVPDLDDNRPSSQPRPPVAYSAARIIRITH